jgi:nitroreductase
VLARLKSIKVEYIDSYIKHMADVREVPLSSLQDFRNMIVAMTQGLSQEEQAQWAAKQTYIALGSLLTTAALMEIDACPMEGIDPAKCDEILGLSGTDYETVVVAALGYRSPDDTMQLAKKVRFPAKQVFTFV